MIVSTGVNRLALVLALVMAGGIVWIGLRDSEPLLIVLGPALLVVAALIRVERDLAPLAFVRRPAPSEPLPAPSNDVEALLHAGNKIAAIRQYRQQTGSGLREAKDAVEAIERRLSGPAG